MKVDARLGERVSLHLKTKGVETPLVEIDPRAFNPKDLSTRALTRDEKIQAISPLIAESMKVLGLDLTDDSLIDTPNRVAKMWVNEIFSGLDYNNFPKCTTIENKMHYDEMVLIRDISCISSCEHHLITIDQKCHVAYIPNKKVLGLSKIPRIAKFFAQRPQVQERFTEQLFHALQYILDTEDVAVTVEGRHFCMVQRGVEDVNAWTVTTRLGGNFKKDHALRKEFYDGIKIR